MVIRVSGHRGSPLSCYVMPNILIIHPLGSVSLMSKINALCMSTRGKSAICIARDERVVESIKRDWKEKQC